MDSQRIYWGCKYSRKNECTKFSNVFQIQEFFNCVFIPGLFEKDKLIFTTQVAFQILLNSKEISAPELDFLLRFPITPNVTSPVDFLNNNSWGAIKSLSAMEDFKNLDKVYFLSEEFFQAFFYSDQFDQR